MGYRVQNNMITGFKIFLISESMIFFSCFGGWLDIGLLPNIFLINNFPANESLPKYSQGTSTYSRPTSNKKIKRNLMAG